MIFHRTILTASLVACLAACGVSRTEVTEIKDDAAVQPLEGSNAYKQAIRCVGVAEAVQLAVANTDKTAIDETTHKLIRGAQHVAAELGKVEGKSDLRVMTDVASFQLAARDLGGKDLMTVFNDECAAYVAQDTLGNAPKQG